MFAYLCVFDIFLIYDQLFTLLSCSAPTAHIKSWEFPRGNLAIERVIGNGAFGVVSKAYARDLPDKPEWTIVAVKSLQGKNDDDVDDDDELFTYLTLASVSSTESRILVLIDRRCN